MNTNKIYYKYSNTFIIIIIFFLTFSFSIVVSAKTYLVCDNITDSDIIIGKIYLYLETDKLTLFKVWTDNAQSTNKKNQGFKYLKEDERIIDNIILETEEHIIFQNNKELDKIDGIFTIGNKDRKNLLAYHCRSIDKDEWVVKN